MNQLRIRLRAVQDGDRDILFEWINDRELLVKNAPYRPTAQANHQQWFVDVTKRSDLAIFVIEELAPARAIGTCQLLNIHPVFQSADLQIRIAIGEQQGKGLGSQAIELLVEHGFRHLNLQRIALQVFATNARAIKAYEKTGFVHEGRLRNAAFIDGQWIDVLCMARLRSDRA
jgi:RimJ/RimL family protein N-acetyltransferase